MRQSIAEEDIKLSSRMAASQNRMQEWRSDVEKYVPVMLYEHCDYGGKRSSLTEGKYNVGDMGLANDSISSIKIKPGYIVDVFENKDFTGAKATFTSDVPCLVNAAGGNWNDRISSFIIYKIGAIVYLDCPFKGSFVMKPAGRYNINEMGVPNDSIRSIRVMPGFIMEVFEHHNFTGAKARFTSDIPCLNVNNWDRRISSFIISQQ